MDAAMTGISVYQQHGAGVDVVSARAAFDLLETAGALPGIRPAPAGTTGASSSAISVVREALTDADRAGRLISAAIDDARSEQAAVAARLERSLAGIRAEADAAVDRARLAREAVLADLRATIDRYRTELQAERARRAPDDAEAGHDGEASRPDARDREIMSMRAALDASRFECARLAALLDEERARRTRLIDAIRTVRSAKSGTLQFCTPLQTASIESRPESPVEIVPASISENDPPPAAIASAPEIDETPADATTGFDAPGYVTQLFDNLEAVYESDSSAGMLPDALVERLVRNLAYASTVFARRVGPTPSPTHDVFEQHLTAVLEARGETVFGRHLAVAAYEFEQQRKRTQVA